MNKPKHPLCTPPCNHYLQRKTIPLDNHTLAAMCNWCASLDKPRRKEKK